jgi:alkanesulfonate monooxygenase SsuD/methylene tetrahydromethanopterin reductase-like flavin-dependent oxidoreductase (luciferase family)
MDAKAKVAEYKDTARAKGREVQVWTYCAVVQRDSREEAEEYLDYFTGPMAENELLDAWQAAALASVDRNSTPKESILAMRQRFAAGSGGPILVGTASDIADQMAEMSEIGIDGILLTWPDFADGVKRLVAPGSVLAELEKRGLREPFEGVQA